MKYKVTANLFYDSEADYNSFWTVLEAEIAKTSVVNMNPGLGNQEKSRVTKLHCNHDEVPVTPCGLETKIEK